MPDKGCKEKTWVCQDREIPNEANPTGSQGASQEKQLFRTRNQRWEALRSSLRMVSEQELQSTEATAMRRLRVQLQLLLKVMGRVWPWDLAPVMSEAEA